VRAILDPPSILDAVGLAPLAPEKDAVVCPQLEALAVRPPAGGEVVGNRDLAWLALPPSLAVADVQDALARVEVAGQEVSLLRGADAGLEVDAQAEAPVGVEARIVGGLNCRDQSRDRLGGKPRAGRGAGLDLNAAAKHLDVHPATRDAEDDETRERRAAAFARSDGEPSVALVVPSRQVLGRVRWVFSAPRCVRASGVPAGFFVACSPPLRTETVDFKLEAFCSAR